MIKRPSPIEKKVMGYLEDLNEDFISQEIVGPYIVDFLHPKLRLIIECDGFAFHHTDEQKNKEKLRDDTLYEMGYKILHLKGFECNNEAVAKARIVEFMKFQRERADDSKALDKNAR